MSYTRPSERKDVLRLHLNENTGGCSPAVLEAVRQVSAADVAVYPDYSALSRECAAYLGVPAEQLVLTNGLDEGLLAATVTSFRVAQSVPGLPEAIVITPAFEMYQVFARAAGGRVVAIPPEADFALSVREIVGAITANTRIVFVNTPNNPTGLVIPRDSLRELVRAVPTTVTVLIDEAYCDFSGETFLEDLPAHPNVLVGRTFAKAHGLAGLRAGCLIGSPARLEMIREVVPPYSLSVFAVAGWRAALRDPQYLASYRKQVEESRNLLYAACDRLGLRYWRSGANFVLIKVGGDTEELVREMAARGVLVRDRSRDPGCRGCIRITAGIVKHTETAVQALEALCAAR